MSASRVIRGGPGATRTPDLRIRSPALYPSELRAQSYRIWLIRIDSREDA